MPIHAEFMMMCDECATMLKKTITGGSTEYNVVSDNESDLCTVADEQGWELMDDVTLCPTCSSEGLMKDYM